MSPETSDLFGWDRLRHGGLLLDPSRLRRIADHASGQPLSWYLEKELRRQVGQVQDGTLKPGDFIAFVLQEICGFTSGMGTWHRGSNVSADWARQTVTGEAVKPRHLWRGDFGAVLPVFIDSESRLGIGRGTKAASQALQWLRAGSERLAVLTNGRQWRLVFAGLDFDAWCQWDIDLWFEEGALAPQVTALRTLLQPALWTPEKKDTTPALLHAILDSRKGQAELSAVLGERVREAVELLVQAHGEVFERDCAGVDRADIYRAAVRVVMRMVVVLFAESREKLLPRDNAIYHGAYGLTGLREELDKVAARSGSRLKRSHSAWPRVLALFRLVFDGSHHPDLPVPEYGGELFAPGDSTSKDGLVRALAVLETACFDHELLFPDSDVHRMLELLTRTKVRIRQGRSSTWASVPVDFSDLSSEYIGILYEGLLDFELKTAPSGDPIIFLAVGNQPALPLSRLEGMDDKAVANLLEKMKDTSGGTDDADEDDERVEATGADGTQVAGEEQEDIDEDAAPDDVVTVVDDNEASGDDRLITRTRAEEWARRAVIVGKLLSKPKGTLTTQKKQAWEDAIGRKARQIVTRVVLPGEWYLVRWGGTRKGSGTFYTRPGLAVPTAHRTLRPLAFTAPAGVGGEPNLDAPAVSWTPRKPEEILAIKVCDPACGSGTFPVAALRFLTEALYASLHHHDRISANGDRAIVRLLDREAAIETREELLRDELLPCRPSDETFEPRLKAILRRHVVERCIYGVDLDPLAVELCRLSLWIETMDRDLPFSFLDHKIKCGNSLVGAWFDTFQHYPVMAWKNREGGDKGHSNGVHFEKDARTKVIKAFVKDTLTPDLQTFLRGQTLFDQDLQERASQAHAGMFATLSRLHELPVHAATDRGRVYRDDVVGSPQYQSLKASMDLWCACWFWPVTEIAHAPRPTTLAVPSEQTRAVAERVAIRKRFFHWELEFPDVFNAGRVGFDAILGNPPWDIAKPNSMEFFSNIDPLYRSYGKQEALEYQGQYFAAEETESGWLDYNGDFRAQSNLVSYAAFAFGDPALVEKSEDKFNIARGHANGTAHAKWRAARAKTFGFADSAHAFQHQGGADLNLYKLFVEQAHALLRVGGRLGFIVPSGLYSDHGTGDLRRLLLDRCRWEWLFGFENRDTIFDIHRSFKFNPVIVEKGGETRTIRTAFMRRRLEDWESAEALATPYSREQVDRFSPRSKAILEIQSRRDLEILEAIQNGTSYLGSLVDFFQQFDMTSDSGLFPPVSTWQREGFEPDQYGLWRGPSGAVALPVFEGRMINQFDPSEKRWVSGKGRRAVWTEVDWRNKTPGPQYLMSGSDYATSDKRVGAAAFYYMKISSATNSRTMIGTVLPDTPSVYSLCELVQQAFNIDDWLVVSAVLNSFAFDFVVRLRLGGLNITGYVLDETPVPQVGSAARRGLARHAASLSFPSVAFAPFWRQAAAAGSWARRDTPWRQLWAVSPADRLRRRCILDAVASALFRLEATGLRWILRDCDRPCDQLRNDAIARQFDPKGFWRIDRGRDPELRHTVLALVAFADLEEKVLSAGGDWENGVEAFLNQNDGDGWMLPETLGWGTTTSATTSARRSRNPWPAASAHGSTTGSSHRRPRNRGGNARSTLEISREIPSAQPRSMRPRSSEEGRLNQRRIQRLHLSPRRPGQPRRSHHSFGTMQTSRDRDARQRRIENP